jgi:GNAT superfamily N-acetyltransferase
MIAVRPMKRAELPARLDDLATLRIAVFRDWPYLYDGSMDYERRYLRPYLDSPGAIVVGAFEGDRLVGAATAAPMEDHASDFAAPLAVAGLVPEAVYYCGESVLLPGWRGRGIGHAFFDHREAQARALGRGHSVFCSVIRPADHPARPADYRPLDAFWTKRGYAPVPGAVARFSWRDIGAAAETDKPLQLWSRAL